MCNLSKKIFIVISPQDVGFFRFLLEGYDHLAQFTVLDRNQALLKVFFSPYQEKEAIVALNDISEVIAFNKVNCVEVQEFF